MDEEGEVASILLDLHRLFTESTHQVPFENVLRWGIRHSCMQPSYEKMSKSEQVEEPNDPTVPMSSDLKDKKEGGPTSPVTPLCLPNSPVPPLTKQFKKKKCKKEEVTRELLQLQDKLGGIRQPTSMNSLNFIIKLAPLPQPLLIQPNNPTEPISSVSQNMKVGGPSPMTPLGLPNSSSEEQLVPTPTKKFKKKKSNKEEVNRELLELQDKPVGISQPTNINSLNFIIKMAPPAQPPLIQPSIKKLQGESNLDVMVASLTCQLDRKEKASKSAQARKRRMQILQERRTSSTRKRQRVQ